jgi:multidrug efflux pump subunit AcrA (membrane-fusion protein)
MRFFLIFFIFTLNFISSLSIAKEKLIVTPEKNSVFNVPATVYSKFDIVVTSEVKGRVTSVVGIGETITKGQVIVTLEDEFEQDVKRYYLNQVEIIEKRIKLLSEQVHRYNFLASESSISKEMHEGKKLELLTFEQEKQSLEIKVSEIQYVISRKNLIAEYDSVVLGRMVSVGEAVSENINLIRILAKKPLYVKAKVPLKILRTLDMTKALLEVEPGLQLTLAHDYVGSEVNISSNTADVSFQIITEKSVMPGVKGRLLINYNK